MSVKQNLFVSVFVHECLMMLNDVEYATFKMIVTQMSNYLSVIPLQWTYDKTLFPSHVQKTIYNYFDVTTMFKKWYIIVLTSQLCINLS